MEGDAGMIRLTEFDGVEENGLYMPNTRKENYSSFFDEDMKEYMDEFRYDINEKGEIVIIKR